MSEDDFEFENEVRRIARLMWPSTEFQGALMEDGRERDALFESDEFINIIECTTSRSKAKAEEDCKKIDQLIKKKTAKYPEKFIRGWFITKHEPTADQRTVASKYHNKIIICGFDQFRSKLIDGRQYLSCRNQYPFGSVRDPESGSYKYDLKYTPLDIFDDDGNSFAVHELSNLLNAGQRIILVGDYGAGKSSTAREIFRTLEKKFFEGKNNRFPIMLNLRDHHGQVEPVEAITRHARQIGFKDTDSLVRAWRGGFISLIIDGFDEIASAGWAAKTSTLRKLRFRSMELIRAFIRETPEGVGILVTGRTNFFDNPRELREALGIQQSALLLELKEFNSKQVREFFNNLGWDDDSVPEWLPTRPLLLAYLAANNLLAKTLENGFASGPAIGWHELLKRVCEREASMEFGPDALTIRQLIEHLASIAKNSVDGLGPITPDQIIDAFREVCGYTPDDKGSVLIQRLPGLGSSQNEDGSRVFVDKDFAEAAFSGVLFKYIVDPYTSKLQPEFWVSSIKPLGSDITALRCRTEGIITGQIIAALVHSLRSERCGVLSASIVMVAKQYKVSSFGESKLFIKDALLDEFNIDDPNIDFHQIEFQESVFSSVEIASDLPIEYWPIFRNCYFGKIQGRTGIKDIPSEKFITCSIDEFEETAKTTQAILSLSLPLSTKVLITILKKLYAQSGSGRKESALYRGLDSRAQELVPEIIQLIKREGFAVKLQQNGDIWLPSRNGEIRRRALKILSSPTTSKDTIIIQSHNIE